uniref:Uncharacterized protein n=1 Tax=Parascaris equorum TaxID=6256 RepID=A0A914RAD8_PAREQ
MTSRHLSLSPHYRQETSRSLRQRYEQSFAMNPDHTWPPRHQDPFASAKSFSMFLVASRSPRTDVSRVTTDSSGEDSRTCFILEDSILIRSPTSSRPHWCWFEHLSVDKARSGTELIEPSFATDSSATA